MEFKGLENACRLALLSSLVYECWDIKHTEEQSKEELKKALIAAKEHFLHAGIEKLDYIDSDGDMLAVADRTTSELFIIFRGTNVEDARDLYNDAVVTVVGKPDLAGNG